MCQVFICRLHQRNKIGIDCLSKINIILSPPSPSLSQGRIQIENGTLTITMLNISDSGLYQCIAENKYASIYSNAELRVIGKLMSPRGKKTKDWNGESN